MNNTRKTKKDLLKELEYLKQENAYLKSRKDPELEQKILLEITQGITTTSNLNELLELIHKSLSKVLYADNFFVALYDPKTELFSFPYFVDKFDQTPEPMALPKSGIAYVFRIGKPLLLTPEVSQRLEEQNEVELIGAPSSSWIGVPLQTPARTIGVLVLQHYEEENVYSEQDVNFLNFAANHIALAIERKRAEEALRESEVKLNVILQSTADGILAVDALGKVIKTNDRFAQIWKIPLSLIDKGDDKALLDFVLEQLIDPEEFMSKVIQLYNSKDEDLDLLHFKDGRIFERYSAPLIMVDSSIGRVWSFRDITDRKLAEEELRNQQLLLRTVIDNIPDSIYCKDTTGRKTLANIMELRFSGVESEAEILGKTDFDFYPKEIAEGFFADDQSVIQSGQPVLDREEYLLDDNGEKQWLLTSKLPLKDKEGNIIGIVGIGHNITERKHAEEEIKKRNEELSKSNAEKDKFFSIIAHDLKSPFQGLLGLTEMMIMGDEDFTKEELVQYRQDMFKTATTVYKLLENLLQWAQMQKGSVSFIPKELLISECIEQNIEVLKQRAFQKGIILINEAPVNQVVYADEKMVDTILRNLLSNAVKFTRRNGKVIVKCNRTNGEMLEVSISDTGIGMSEKNVKRLFKIEEKVSSKGTDDEESTGLGLLLCKEFVEKNGGEIWVESEEGRGSTFYFTLRLQK